MDLTDDPLAGIDAEELESDIDKAIDELFVKKGESQQPVVAEEAPAEEPVVELSEEPAPAPSAAAEVDFLGELKEKLLTLDWEITAENIQSFENELQAVSDKLGDDRHSGRSSRWPSGCYNISVPQRVRPLQSPSSFSTPPREA